MAIIAAGAVTAATLSAWPDLIVGIGIFGMNVDASRQVYSAAWAERRIGLQNRSSGFRGELRE